MLVRDKKTGRFLSKKISDRITAEKKGAGEKKVIYTTGDGLIWHYSNSCDCIICKLVV